MRIIKLNPEKRSQVYTKIKTSYLCFMLDNVAILQLHLILII